MHARARVMLESLFINIPIDGDLINFWHGAINVI